MTTLHDFLTVCPTGTLFNYGTGRCCGLTPLSAACITSNCDSRSYAHKLWRVGRQVVQARVGGLPAEGGHFIAISEATDRMLRELLPRDAQLHHVHNFTEVPRRPPVDVGDNVNVIYVGRLSAEKGPLLLADCLQRVGARGVFVGDGDLREAVRTRCPSAVTTGWVAPEGVREHLAQARMLVLPSLWFEAQGLVVAEAAAMGIPSIVPDTSGARDWVDDGIDGFWFRGGDADDLSSADPAAAARTGVGRPARPRRLRAVLGRAADPRSALERARTHLRRHARSGGQRMIAVQRRRPLAPALVALWPLAAMAAPAVVLLGLGQADLLRVVYLVLALAIGHYLQRHDTGRYVGFILWLWFLSPFVRRVADLYAGWQDPSLVLLTRTW